MLPSDEEWKILSDVANALAPLKVMSTVLGGSNYITLPLVLPLALLNAKRLKDPRWQQQYIQHSWGKKFAERLSQELTKRFHPDNVSTPRL